MTLPAPGPTYSQNNEAQTRAQIDKALSSSSGSSAATAVTYTPPWTGAVVQSLATVLRERCCIFDFMTATQISAVVAGTATFDTTPILATAQSAIALNQSWNVPSGAYIAGPQIYFPPGKYRFLTQPNLIATVRLTGCGNGMTGGAPTLWSFAAGAGGPIFNRYNTLGNGLRSPTGYGADGSILEGIALISDEAGTGTSIGAWMRCRALIRDCLFSGWGGHTIQVVADSGGGATTQGNANGWGVEHCRLQTGGASALYIQGGDSNSGVTLKLDISGMTGWGIDDQSFLGNTHLGPEAESCGKHAMVSYGGNRYVTLTDANLNLQPDTNPASWQLLEAGGVTALYPAWSSATTYTTGGPYRVSNANARTVVLNGYSEGSQPPSDAPSAPSQFLGGIFAGPNADNKNSFTKRTQAPFLHNIVGGVGVYGTSGRGIGDLSADNAGNSVTNIVGGDGNVSTIFGATNTAYGPSTFRWRWSGADMRLDYAAADAQVAWYITGPSTVQAFGRTTTVKYTFAVRQIVIGDGAGVGNGRLQFNGTAIPSTTGNAAGEICWNRTPTLGGNLGWVCTAQGTPDTWSPFGNSVLEATATYDPPSIAVGASATTTVTVTGAALGDLADVSFSLDLQGLSLSAYVSAANTVTVVFANLTAGAVDLASGTLKARLRK